MTALRELVCGEVRGSGRFAKSLKHLGDTLVLLNASLRMPLSVDHPAHRLVVPFFARSLVEVACTILIGRLDSFRLLTLAEMQSQGTYNPAIKLASAIQWSGDVLTPDGAVRRMWDAATRPTDMSRALLGDYNEHVTWRPGFTALLDYFSQLPSTQTIGPWSEALRNIGPPGFLPSLRGQMTALYSTASKGVHHEFVLSFPAYFDDATLDQLSEDALRFVATLAVVVNFVEHVAFALTPNRAFDCFEELQK